MKSMLSDNRTKTIERGHQYFATDRNGECWSYQYKPEFVGNEEWQTPRNAIPTNELLYQQLIRKNDPIIIDPSDSLVDINDLQVVTPLMAINRTKALGHRFFAVDGNDECWSYQYKPTFFTGNNEWVSTHTAQFIGYLYTTTQSHNTLVDTYKITL